MLAGLLLAGSTSAWATYKIIGPDGQVTFSDMPPAPGQGKVQMLGGPSAQPSGDTPQQPLPSELREAASKYPVTLYTTKSCAACDDGRQFLRERGIPFTEKSVTSTADIADFKKMTGNSLLLPLLSLGSTKLPAGFNATSWSNALDAAGYPKTNMLPQGYSQPAAQPLVPPTAEQKPKASQPQAPAALPSVPVLPPPNPKAPPGFQF